MSQSFLRKLRRAATKEGIKAGTVAPEKRKLTAQECLELKELNRVASAEAFKANQIRANTALMPARRTLLGFIKGGGSELAAEAEAIARLLANVRAEHVRRIVAACGYPPDTLCDLNLETGEIILNPAP